MAGGGPTAAPLVPATIVAAGPSGQAFERLPALQSTIARFVHLAAGIGRLRPKLRFDARPSLRFR